MAIHIQSIIITIKALICYEQPANHPFISDSEKLYLQRKIEDYEKERNALPSTPWKSIFESAPVLALSFSTVRLHTILSVLCNRKTNVLFIDRVYMLGPFILLIMIYRSIWMTCFMSPSRRTEFIHHFLKYWASWYQPVPVLLVI